MNHWQKAVYLFSTLIALAPFSVLGIMAHSHASVSLSGADINQNINPSDVLDLLKKNITIPQGITLPTNLGNTNSLTVLPSSQTPWNLQTVQDWLKNEVGIDVVKLFHWLFAMGKIILGFFMQFLTMVLGAVSKITKP